MLVDNLDIEDVNSVNKRAAISAALLLLPSKFTEVGFLFSAQKARNFTRLYTITHRTLAQEDLYAKICSLSYMGDLRMFFAEDTNKVREPIPVLDYIILFSEHVNDFTFLGDWISDSLVQSLAY